MRQGLVVVITGASAGVGRAVAQQFGKEKAKIGLISRNQDALEATKREIEQYGGQALILKADVADAHVIEQAAEQVESQFGPIDIWINNAMVSVFSPVKEMTADEYKRVTDVTYLGYVNGTLAALKRMLPRNKGVILQVGSALSYRAIPLQSAYCAAKHAIKGFTESLRCELIHDRSNVKVVMVQMPALNTPQFSWVKSRLPNKPQPVPPIYQPEVAAQAIMWAAEHTPRELKVGYSTLEAIIGEKFIPGWLDKYLANKCYFSQQTDEPVEVNRRDNLWQPVPGDHGAHGTFDSRSHKFSLELWLATHKGLVTGLCSCISLAIAASLYRCRKNL